MTAAVADTHDDHGPAKGFTRWLFTTNHKDIGTLYLVLSLVMFFVGGAMALIIRSELMAPGLQFVHPEFFNQMTTVHALVMVFGAVMPAFVGLANWMIPMMIGAPDMALTSCSFAATPCRAHRSLAESSSWRGQQTLA